MRRIVALGLVLLVACGGTETSPNDIPSSPGPRAPDPTSPPAQDGTPSATPPNEETPAPAKPSTGCGSSVAPGNLDWTLSVGGRSRAVRVHVPAAYDGKTPTPVLLNFHGRNSNAAQQELLSKTTAKSDAARFLVVYPTGIGQTWNAGLCCGQAQSEKVDDVAFTRALVDELEAKLCVDAKRVFATGLSNGGFFANRLACELADRIAAIGPVAGQLLSTSCAPKRPVPVMHFHGTEDTVVSYDGQLGVAGVEPSVAAWAKRNGCASTTKTTYAKGDATCVTYDGCKEKADVTLCTIQGGGHTWPGGLAVPGLGKTSQDIDATSAMWDFFVAHPMP